MDKMPSRCKVSLKIKMDATCLWRAALHVTVPNISLLVFMDLSEHGNTAEGRGEEAPAD